MRRRIPTRRHPESEETAAALAAQEFAASEQVLKKNTRDAVYRSLVDQKCRECESSFVGIYGDGNCLYAALLVSYRKSRVNLRSNYNHMDIKDEVRPTSFFY
jgi:hypothetical protein